MNPTRFAGTAGLVFLLALAGCGSPDAEGLDYAQAKARADQQEEALKPAAYRALGAAQQKAAGPAFAACMPSPPPDALPDFVIVMRLDADGQVDKTWRKGDSGFAQCVEQKFASATLFTPPEAPFFTSFDFSFED